MPTYDYECEPCKNVFTRIKSIKDALDIEKCDKCGLETVKIISHRVHFTGTKVEDVEFNHGLGKLTKSKKHRDEIAKRLGCEEIGNEKTDVLHSHFDREREEKRRKSWDEI